MPITPKHPVRRLSQDEFGELAYSVMGCVFEIHRDFGCIFDEKIYKRELASRFPGVEIEFPISVMHGTFSRTYYVDALVGDGGAFEFKAVELLVPRHRRQLYIRPHAFSRRGRRRHPGRAGVWELWTSGIANDATRSR